MPGPYTGLDPALLAPPLQPSPELNPAPNPLDVVGQAVAALQAMGAPPSLEPALAGGVAGTELMTPEWSPPPAPPIQNSPDYPVQWGDLSPAMQQAGVFDTPPVHTAPAPVTNHTVRPASEIYPAQRLASADEAYPTLDPVAQATADEQAAFQAAGDAARAQKSAEVLHAEEQATKLAAAYDQSAREMAEADAFYKEARAAAHREADAETATWLQQYTELAKQEPNPKRWWDNLSGLGQALWGLSVVFDAAASISSGAQNVAMNMIMDNIHRDVEEQKARLGRELDALKAKGGAIRERHTRNLTDAADDHTMALGRLQALRQAYVTRAQAPGATGMQAGLAAADAWFAQQVQQLATARRDQAVQLRENQLNRSQAAYLAAKQRELTWNMQSREIGKDYDLAALAASAKAQGEGPEKDYREIPLHMGAKLVGSSRGEVPVVHKEQHEKIGEVFANGNKRHRALTIVNEALENGSFAERLMKADPELNAATQELGYTAVKMLQGAGVVSDADLKAGKQSQFGIDPSGNLADAVRFQVALPQIQKMIKRNLADLPLQVSNQATQYLDAKVVGKDAHIVWRPTPLHRDEGATPNITEALGGMLVRPPSSVQDYETKAAYEKTDPMFRGRALPQYDKAAVSTFKGAAVGLGPEQIRALAADTINNFADPWSGKPVHGDPSTTRFAIESEAAKATKQAEAAAKELKGEAVRMARGRVFGSKGAPSLAEVTEMAKRGDVPLTDAPDAIEQALKAAQEEYAKFSKQRSKWKY